MTTNSETTQFSELILGFSSAALYCLGSVDVENKKIGEMNLPLAKHNIDILEMLKVKTNGNLNQEESNLLTQVIHDLKIKYVESMAGASGKF